MGINHGLLTDIDIDENPTVDIDLPEPSANPVTIRQEIVSNFSISK